MKKRALLLAAFAPVLLFAHPGHGMVQHGFAHYLTSPIHLVGILAVVMLGVVLFNYKRLTSKNNA